MILLMHPDRVKHLNKEMLDREALESILLKLLATQCSRTAAEPEEISVDSASWTHQTVEVDRPGGSLSP